MHARLKTIGLAGLFMATGCQRYQPQPLQLEAHRAAWQGRSPDDITVHAFATELAETGRLEIPFDLTDGLSLEEAEVVALVFNPRLRESRARAGVAAATAEHAGLWEDPVLEVDALRILESVPDPWITGIGLGFTIPVSGRLGVERSLADAERSAEATRAAVDEWLVLGELRGV